MTPIRTILLLPHAGHRGRVLAPHAPSCRRIAPGSLLSWGTLVGEPGDVRHHVAHAGSCPVDEHVHLPLARDGAVVPEGVDRLKRAMGGVGNYDRATLALLDGEREVVRDTRKGLAAVGTIVLLDADGKEVVDV